MRFAVNFCLNLHRKRRRVEVFEVCSPIWRPRDHIAARRTGRSSYGRRKHQAIWSELEWVEMFKCK